MKIPGFKRFQEQDYPKKYNDLTEKVFTVLNPFMEVVTQALSKRLNFNDNFDCVDITLDITAPVTDYKIKNTQGGVMRACQVLSCINKNQPSDPLTSAPFVQFVMSTDGQFIINNITGVTSGKTYTIRMLFTR